MGFKMTDKIKLPIKSDLNKYFFTRKFLETEIIDGETYTIFQAGMLAKIIDFLCNQIDSDRQVMQKTRNSMYELQKEIRKIKGEPENPGYKPDKTSGAGGD